ncbi:hypothetical protein [Nonomuraea glycinis]|uniref:hypothetical protein n=1 Tax=Nonomuraea glycinis TaxID=2047744 RepID=UPI0033B89A43
MIEIGPFLLIPWPALVALAAECAWIAYLTWTGVRRTRVALTPRPADDTSNADTEPTTAN